MFKILCLFAIGFFDVFAIICCIKYLLPWDLFVINNIYDILKFCACFYILQCISMFIKSIYPYLIKE